MSEGEATPAYRQRLTAVRRFRGQAITAGVPIREKRARRRNANQPGLHITGKGPPTDSQETLSYMPAMSFSTRSATCLR